MSRHTPTRTIFRRYDIRGIVGSTLTDAIVHKIGRGFGSELVLHGDPRVIVARDARPSSSAFASALIDGVMATGVEVTDIGAIATPVAHFAAQHLQIPNIAVITGSHNPSDYNGVKLTLDGMPLHRDHLIKLYERIIREDFVCGAGSHHQQNVTDAYAQAIQTHCTIERPFNVGIDCGNGITGKTVPRILRAMGCTVTPLYCEIDGHFPNHHPNPAVPENLTDLQALVVNRKLDIGFAFDGDGDRMTAIDNSGRIIWPDRQMMLFAQAILQERPGATILFDVKSSQHLETVITEAGGQPLMWQSGSTLLREKMEQDDIPFGGELSGHLFFRDRWFGFDDGLYTATRLLELLSSTQRSSAAVFADLPDSLNTPELNIDFGSELRLAEFMQTLQRQPLPAEILHVHRIDGLRMDFASGWALVRASNTTPTLSIRFEADDATALAHIQILVKKLLHRVDPQLKLPF